MREEARDVTIDGDGRVGVTVFEQEGEEAGFMVDYQKFEAFNHAYEIVTTVDVSGRDGESYRIEVKRNCLSTQVSYSTTCWILQDVTLQPTAPYTVDQTGIHFEREPESMLVWVEYHLPWVSQPDPESALSQALGFLAERIGTD